jgi:hypothetical protein
MSYELVQLIRDIAIIVMAVLVTTLSITLLIVLRKVYPPLRRGSRNFEMASTLMLDAVGKVSALVNIGSELAGLISGVVQRLLGRSVRPEEDTPSSTDC